MQRTPVFGPIERLSELLALVAGCAVVLLSFLIVFDIFARSVLQYSLQGTDELGGYTLALIGSLGLARTLLHRGHPRIDIAIKHLPRAVRGALHVLAYAAMSGFAVFMADRAIGELQKTFRFGSVTNTPLQTPLWVPQIIWVGGMLFFAAIAILCTLHGLWLLFRRPDAVEAQYGPPTVEEDVQDYAGDLTAASPQPPQKV
jgi:TRAP-type C4-dicarboxylate transport system permease small subunit